MIHRATVEGISESVEEEAVIRVDGVRLTVFVTDWRLDAAIGATSRVELSLWAADGIEIAAVDGPVAVERLGETFGYRVVFKVQWTILQSVVEFTVESFAQDYAFLDGKQVVCVADRINAEFIQ